MISKCLNIANVGSTLTQLVAGATRASLTVDVPAPAALTMTRSATSDFADPALSLTGTTYSTATEGNGNALNADTDTGTVTVVTGGGTAETVNFGGTVTLSGQPADAAHTASFDVTFTY